MISFQLQQVFPMCVNIWFPSSIADLKSKGGEKAAFTVRTQLSGKLRDDEQQVLRKRGHPAECGWGVGEVTGLCQGVLRVHPRAALPMERCHGSAGHHLSCVVGSQERAGHFLSHATPTRAAGCSLLLMDTDCCL